MPLPIPNPNIVTRDEQGRARFVEGAWDAMTPEERAEWLAWARDPRTPEERAKAEAAEAEAREFYRTDPATWLSSHYNAELWADYNGKTRESVWEGVCEVWGLPKREVEAMLLQRLAEERGRTVEEVRYSIRLPLIDNRQSLTYGT